MMTAGRMPKAGGLCLALGIVIIPVYSGVLSVPFQYDDFHSIVENSHIRSLSNIPAFFFDSEMFSEDPRSAMYRPLVLLSHAIDYQLHGYDAGRFHWTNLALHTAATCLVALLALTITRSPGGAMAAGVVFGLHPVNAEAVVYVSSRSESMCAVFFLFAFHAYIRIPMVGGTSRRALWMTVSVAAYAAALLSKAVGITLPVVLFLYELMHSGDLRDRLRQLWRIQWPYWGMTLVYIALVRQMVHQAVVEFPVRGMGTQLWTQIKGLTYYLKLLVIPYPLSVEHQFNLGHGLAENAVIGGALLLLSIGVLLCVFFRAEDRSGLFWMLWPFAALLPTLVIPLNVLVNEHRLYLPSIALAMVAAILVARYWGAHRILVGAFVTLLAASFALQDIGRVRIWQDSEMLWADAVKKGPGMPRPHIYLGDNLKESGKHEEALQSYYAALRVNPSILSGIDQVVAYNNIGSTLLEMGRSQEAIQAYQTTLRLDSTYTKAREALQGLLAFQPNKREDATALHKQGLLALWNGRVQFAIACLRGALEIERSAGTLMALGTAYERDGNLGGAVDAYRDIVENFGDEIFAAAASRKADSLSALGSRND